MRARLSFRSLVAASLFAAASMLTFAPTASALTQVHLSCESGGSRYHCSVFHDATSPPTIRWWVNGTPIQLLNDKDWTGFRSCQARRNYDVTVAVTDSTGTIGGTCTFVCNAGPWP